MKRLLIFSLTVVLVAGLVLAGCGGDEETTTAVETTASATTASATTTTAATTATTGPDDGTITPDEAFDHIGDTLTVVGEVADVVDRGDFKARWSIYMGEYTFQAVVEYEYIDLFPDLTELVGKTLEVTGEIEENTYESMAQIYCPDPSQILVDGEPLPAPTAQPTTTEPTTTEPTTTEPASTAINWDEAIDHVLETATVVGPVVGVNEMALGSGGSKTLLYLGDEDTGCVAMILSDNYDQFPTLADYEGKTIEVTGEIGINSFTNQAQIDCTESSQIVIVGGEEPEPTTTEPGSTALNWDEAYDHIGETGTVVGPVIEVIDKGEGLSFWHIILGDEYIGTYILIRYADVANFPPITDYADKTLEVTGLIYLNSYHDFAQIDCNDQSQIVIVE